MYLKKGSSDDKDSPAERPVASPPRSCLRSGPIKSRRVTFSQEDPGGVGSVKTQPVKLLQPEKWKHPHSGQRSEVRSLSPPLLSTMFSVSGDLNDVTQEVDVSVVSLLRDEQGHAWSNSWSLQNDRTCPRCLGVSELSAVLGGLLQLVEQNWNGPGSLQRNQRFLGGAYDLLSELLQPVTAGVRQDGDGAGFTAMSRSLELVLLRGKLERTEQQLETMKRMLVSTLTENYELKRKKDQDLTSEQPTHSDTVT